MFNSRLNIPTLLTESDIKPLFSNNNHATKLLGVLPLVLVLILVPYLQKTPTKTETSTQSQQIEKETIQKSTEKTETKAVVASTKTTNQITIPNNTLSYAEVNISSPIVWNTNFDNKEVLNKLQNGVVHINGTAQPGQKGVAVLFGHSSNYPWVKGDYNSVFAGLFKAKVDDKIEINYSNQQYSYIITKIYEVKSTNLSVMNDNSYTGIRLITCSPIGTNLRRLIVEAKQVSPDSESNQDFKPQYFSGSIPESR